MQDFRFLQASEFTRLSSAEQRRYLRTLAEHLAEMTRVHAHMTSPRPVGPETSDGPS